MATVEIGAPELLLVALLVLLNAAVSAALGLGLGRKLVLASVRAVVQLGALGLILGWVFDLDQAWIVAGWMVAMALFAGFEAVRRVGYRISGLHAVSVVTMLVTSMAIALYATRAVLALDPWTNPRYSIPILGMVLGNTLNGVSLGLERTLAGFSGERERVEMLLAHGATRAQAGRDVVRQAVRTGMIPILNAMAAAGLISIPGMMTGQILAGESPLAAAGYQIFILFAIAGGVALGTVGVVLGSSRLVFDGRERLRAERIRSIERP